MDTITDGAWLPLSDVLHYLGITAPEDSPEARVVDRARLAAAAYVERHRPDLLRAAAVDEYGEGEYGEGGYGGGYIPNADVFEGALLLTARLHARRSSPTGLASYGEFGPAAVLRFDPDVERLLGLGRYAAPALG